MARRQRFAAWPFLIGRALVRPIQVVAAPRPLCDARMYGILHQLTAQTHHLTSFGHAYWRAWRRPDAQAFHLVVVFHLIQATERHIGGDTDRPLLDRGGRPIELAEGFVSDQAASPLYLPGSMLLDIHLRVIDLYHQFWEADGDQPYRVVPTQPLMTAPPITNPRGNKDGVVMLHQLEPYISNTPAFEGLHFIAAPPRHDLTGHDLDSTAAQSSVADPSALTAGGASPAMLRLDTSATPSDAESVAPSSVSSADSTHDSISPDASDDSAPHRDAGSNEQSSSRRRWPFGKRS